MKWYAEPWVRKPKAEGKEIAVRGAIPQTKRISASSGQGEGETLNFLVPSFLAKSTEHSEGLVRLWRNFAQKFFIQEIP